MLTQAQALEHLSTLAEQALEAGAYAPAVSALTKFLSLEPSAQEGRDEYDLTRLSDGELASLLTLLDKARC